MLQIPNDLNRVDEFTISQLIFNSFLFMALFYVYECCNEVLIRLRFGLLITKVCAADPDGHVKSVKNIAFEKLVELQLQSCSIFDCIAPFDEVLGA